MLGEGKLQFNAVYVARKLASFKVLRYTAATTEINYINSGLGDKVNCLKNVTSHAWDS